MLLKKTKLGRTAFSERSALFTPRQRAAFILFDGHKTVANVLLAMAPTGLCRQDVKEMREKGFLEPVTESVPSVEISNPPREQPRPVALARSDSDRYLQAKPLATQVTARLGLRGFRLNLAVEAAASVRELAALLPKMQAAAGIEACRELELLLKE